jgi:predicted esterase
MVALTGCPARTSGKSSERKGSVVASPAPHPSPSPAAPDPIRVEPLDSTSPPVFVTRGGPRGAGRLVFLHGICGHGLGYAQSFTRSAAKYGTLIAPQGDLTCAGALSKWSNDIAALDGRITRAFKALGDPDPEGELTVIGMSQGATRAVELVTRYPRRYTRLISMAAPVAVKPGQLRSLRSAVMMAGELDRQDLMRESARALTTSRVPVTFMRIPQAVHGAMGPTPEQTMAEALDWLFSH